MPKLTSGSALFIQPHYDDVPLSCGGTVALLARNRHEPHMVTVFASELLPQMVGEFAAWKHERWKLTDPDRVLEARRAEEIRHLPEWREGNRVFVPLGIGSHVDHQLVFEAGRCLAAQGAEVYA
jgi:hypothetical protein